MSWQRLQPQRSPVPRTTLVAWSAAGNTCSQLALAEEHVNACDNQDYLPSLQLGWRQRSTDPSPGWLYTLPVPRTLPGAGQTVIPDPFLSPSNTNRATDLAGFSDSTWLSGVYFPYMKSRFAYLCPTDTQSPDWSAEPRGTAGQSGRNNKLSSYIMNGAACNFGQTPEPVTCKASAMSGVPIALFVLGSG